MFFYELEKKYQNKEIFIDDQGHSFGAKDFLELEQKLVDKIPEGSLVFLFAENSYVSVATYLTCLRRKIVPVMISPSLNEESLKDLFQTYRPNYIFARRSKMEHSGYQCIDEIEEYQLWQAKTLHCHTLHPDLALLLTTSGSTGSPKLVRQSYRNIQANAASIAEYLHLSEKERPITTLPLHYTYGLSVIHSHLLVGASILLTERSVVDKDFWSFLKKEKATSIAGVPYTYTMLERFRFFKMDLPHLKTMTQAGGKLSLELHQKYAEYAERTGKSFVVMYGQTEATARMAYLPAEKALEKVGAMGIAIPGGRFELMDELGRQIGESNRVGELVYYGDNVTLGYAEKIEDLSTGDERNGRLETGDMAKMDEEGYYTIVGRKKRFLKIFGNRVNLDEIERKCASAFPNSDFASIGQDDAMKVYYTNRNYSPKEIINFLEELTGFHPSAFAADYLEEIPKNEAGKTLYAGLEEMIEVRR